LYVILFVSGKTNKDMAIPYYWTRRHNCLLPLSWSNGPCRNLRAS